ncbi:MAG: hypothetical protein ACOCY1_04380 [Halovenus sp.]
MNEYRRRTVLLGAAGLATAGLAGCVGDSGGDSDDGSGATGGVEDSSITHLGSDCAGPDPDTVTVFADGQTYAVEGSLPANVPCYEPDLVDVGVADGTLSLTVDIVETTTDDEGCVDCEGQVDYEATVEVSETTTVETVSVTHESGETHTVERSSFVGGKPTIRSSSIETIQTGSRTDEESDAADLDSSDGTVTIDGTILTSTPHYEAVLEDVAIQRRALQVTIGTESTLGEDEAGTQELGFLDYEATIEIENIDSLERAEVQHPNTAHGFEWEENSASASASGSGETGTSSEEANASASRNQ